jgi:hypothetical protein|tara:strand:- start:124 stop:324 length:201 start_codon:yes stop_codon:yes gene_type:complete
MKEYLIKETQIAYKTVVAKSKKEAIEKSVDKDDYDDFGDLEITSPNGSKLFLMSRKYSATIVDRKA